MRQDPNTATDMPLTVRTYCVRMGLVVQADKSEIDKPIEAITECSEGYQIWIADGVYVFAQFPIED